MFLVFVGTQMVYLILPKIAKKHFELLDYNKDAGHKLSCTGCASVISVLLLVLYQGQKISMGIDSDQKLHMSLEERSFRNRQKFMTEISIYILLMISTVLMTMNHMMSVNRKYRMYSDMYKELPSVKNAGKKKDSQAKKND